MFGKKPTRIAHPLAHQFYSYVLGERFDPGAQCEVFAPHFQNPVYTVSGPGVPVLTMRVLQHPQTWFKQQVGIQGLGGVQAGYLRGQPLLDPEELP